MIKRLRKQVTGASSVVLLLILFTSHAYALDPNRSLSEFAIQLWLTESGLPQNTIQAITQTRDGYIWIGTQEGLARYNGVGFVIFDRENTTQFKSNDIRTLIGDRSGSLWIGTSFGLIRYKDGSFTSFTRSEGLPDNTVNALAEDQSGTIWIATGNGLARYANNSIEPVPTINANIQTLLLDSSGVLWLGTGTGVVSFQNNAVVDRKAAHQLSGLSVTSAVQDSSGRLWFGTNDGLFSVKGDEVESYGTDNGLRDEQINFLLADREGSIWIGSSGGLARLRSNGPFNLSWAENLSSNLILSMFEDREGSLWIGTEAGGLNLIRDKKFTTFTTKQGLANDVIKAIYQDASGAIWIGTNGGGVSVVKDGQVKNYSTNDGLSSNVVLSLYGDNKGTIWIGTPDGLNEFKNGRFTTLTVADGLSSDLVRSIYFDRNGVLWVGTRNGLNRIKDGHFTRFTMREGLANDFIGSILEDSKGTLWVGTLGGLSEFKDEKFTNFTTKHGLSNDVITALHEDGQQNIWIGTNGGGLNRFNNGRFTSYTTRQGLLDNVIYRIMEDSEKNLWFSSPKGIFKISLNELNELAEGRLQNLNTTPYGTSDGMLTRECSGGGYPAGWQGVDGKLWFPTIKGVAMIDPVNAHFNSQPPPVVIEQVRIDDKDVPSTGAVQLAPGTTRLDFYYAALSFIAPNKVKFKYRLEGFDPDWIEGSARRAFYTNLKPGNYRFHVVAANNDGVWNMEGAVFEFYLKPHFYQTYWFYALVILLLGLTVWMIYHLRVRRMKTQFDAVLAERTRIAREIHDNLAQEMLGISVQLELVARTMPADAETAKGHLDRVRLLVRHGIAEARRYVWDLRSHALENADLPTALSETARRLTSNGATQIETKVQVSGTFRPLPRPVEDNLLRIGQEAINNAVHHAEPQTISVNLNFDSSSVQLSVKDDGRGFDQAKVKTNGHFGLVGMRERAARIGGTLNVVSSPGEGTEIVVNVPIKS